MSTSGTRCRYFRRNKAAFPKHVNQSVQYDTEVQCVVSYLSQYQMQPYARIKEAMADLFQVHVSEGTVNNILRRACQHLDVFDTWACYFRFAILHVLCGAQILSALIHAHEQQLQAWAEKLITCLLDARKEADEARTNARSAVQIQGGDARVSL